MAVQKINGFTAPYRSQTFQQQADAQTQRNGVLAMSGKVSQSGGVVTVPALTFIQQGLIVKRDVTTTINSPSMAAPYYLVVTAGSAAQTDDLQFAFAKTPLDVAAASVIVAYYDGGEWRMPPMVSAAGILADVDQANLDYGKAAPVSGLLTTVVASNYRNSPGVLVDTAGHRQTMLASALFPVIAQDPDFSRVDRIVYRRPADATNRIGSRRFTLGGTYASSPTAIHPLTGFFDSTVERPKVKILVGSDNAVHALAASGYGTSFQLTYKKLASDRVTVLVTPVSLANMSEAGFAAAIDGSNNLHVVFIQNSQVFYQKFGPTGTSLVSATRIDSQSTPSTAPAVAIDPNGTKVFVAYQSLLGAANNQIFFTTRDLNGSLVTSPVNLTHNASNLQHPDVFVTDDLWVYVAWEDSVSTKVYYQIFNDIGVSLSSAASVSTATTRVGFGTLVDLAQTPKVRVADNKSVFVTFLQDKGGSTFGLSVWNDGTAFMQQLLAANEAFVAYDVDLGSTFNGLNLTLARSSSVDYVRLEGQTVMFTLNLSGSGASSVTNKRDALGSMYHLWSETLSAGFTSYQSNVTVQDIGPETLVGSVTPTVAVAANQFMVHTSAFSGEIPRTGDRVVISAANVNGNNGTYLVNAVQTISLNAVNDNYLVTVNANFAAVENPSLGTKAAFSYPSGNQVDAVKTTSELQSQAYRLTSLPTDELLTRIGIPGTYILNWLTNSQPALNANTLLVHGNTVNIDWGKTTVGSLTVSGGMKILDMINNVDYSLADGAYVMVDGSALYVTLTSGNTAPTPAVTPVANLPWSTSIAVLGVLKDGKFNPSALLSAAGLGQLDVGEGDIIGEDLPLSLRARAGFSSESTYVAYPSTIVVGVNDDYPTAIGKLDAQVGAIETNKPLEDNFFGDGVTTQPTFTTSVAGLSWSTNAATFDIQVFVDGRRQYPWSGSGPLLDGQFRKLTITSVQLAGLVHPTSVVAIRKEGANYGGPAAPSAGKLWSDTVDHHIVGPDTAFNVGASANRFAAGYFANVFLNQLTLATGLGNVVPIKTKTNGSGAGIVAGMPVSLYQDGQIYPASANSTQGQRMVGIALAAIASGQQGSVLLFNYNLPGVLTGLGFAPGDEVFVAESGAYTNGSTGLSGASDTIARIGFADCAGGIVSAAATDLILAFQTIAEAP